MNESGSWSVYWRNGEWVFDRFQGWRDQRNKLTWFHHQGDVDLDIPTYQAKLKDTLDPFGDGRMGRSGLFGDRPFSLVVYECSAQGQFGTAGRNPWITEEEGDLRGFLLCCTKGASFPGGYGNGARRPDGSVL